MLKQLTVSPSFTILILHFLVASNNVHSAVFSAYMHAFKTFVIFTKYYVCACLSIHRDWWWRTWTESMNYGSMWSAFAVNIWSVCLPLNCQESLDAAEHFFCCLKLIFSLSLEGNWEKITLLWWWSIAVLLLRKIKVQWAIDLFMTNKWINLNEKCVAILLNCEYRGGEHYFLSI